MSKADPSLPQRAGKALQRFKRAQVGKTVYSPPIYAFPGRGKQKVHAISVRAVRQPEPDLDKLARALLQIAREQQQRDEDQAA